MSRILIVGNPASFPPALERLLRADDICPVVASSEEAASALTGFRYDCAVVDASGTGFDLVTFCRRIRAVSRVPLILLTKPNDAPARIHALQSGADDSVSQPVNPQELIARIRAIMRGRSLASSPPPRLVCGPLTLDLARHEASVDGQVAPLTCREYALLLCLAQSSGCVVARKRLFEDVWGYDSALAGKLLDVYIGRLRAKLGDLHGCPVTISTVRGVGYRLDI